VKRTKNIHGDLANTGKWIKQGGGGKRIMATGKKNHYRFTAKPACGSTKRSDGDGD